MGIYDRDYYREETARSLWITGRTPTLVALVVANVVVFVIQWLDPTGPGWGWVTSSLDLEAAKVIDEYQVWRLVTYMFCHAGPWHILWNMLFLWWFGGEVEKIYGSREFLIFYFLAGLVASLTMTITDWWSGSRIPTVGASGAVMGVVVVFTLYNPRHHINIYGIFPIEMRWMLLIYLAADTFGLIQPGYSPVAHVAHLAGAAYGFAFKYFDLRVGHLFSRRIRLRRPRLRVVTLDREEPIEQPPPRPAVLDEALEHRMDQILAKIAREGKASLNDEEQAILEQASRRLRDRRG